MTYEQFVFYASDLRNHSCLIDDDWNLQEYKNPMVSRKTETNSIFNIYCQTDLIFSEKIVLCKLFITVFGYTFL